MRICIHGGCRYACKTDISIGISWTPEDVFNLAINWRKDDCWAGQGNNYRAQAMSGLTLSHIKTRLCCPELHMKTCK